MRNFEIYIFFRERKYLIFDNYMVSLYVCKNREFEVIIYKLIFLEIVLKKGNLFLFYFYVFSI